MSHLDGLDGKVAIVTGGSRGIGQAVVETLSRQGVSVIFNYVKSQEESKQLVEKIQSAGGQAMAIQGDVRDKAFCENLLSQARAKYGRLDFVVNNAGILRDKLLMMMGDEDWKDVLETNLYGAFYLSRLAIVHFLKQKSGSIVSVSSTAGLIGNQGQVNYSASKAGLIGFTKALAKEVAGYGVRINAVAPGYIETDMTRQMPTTKITEALKLVPMKRAGQTQEVARVVAWLLSDESSYITGQVIPIDGGLAI